MKIVKNEAIEIEIERARVWWWKPRMIGNRSLYTEMTYKVKLGHWEAARRLLITELSVYWLGLRGTLRLKPDKYLDDGKPMVLVSKDRD